MVFRRKLVSPRLGVSCPSGMWDAAKISIEQENGMSDLIRSLVMVLLECTV